MQLLKTSLDRRDLLFRLAQALSRREQVGAKIRPLAFEALDLLA
jgi:hypothetical protein